MATKRPPNLGVERSHWDAGVEYVVGDPAESYTCTGPDGSEVVLTLAQLDAGSEDVAEPPEGEDGGVDLSRVDMADPKARAKAMAKAKAEAGL